MNSLRTFHHKQTLITNTSVKLETSHHSAEANPIRGSVKELLADIHFSFVVKIN